MALSNSLKTQFAKIMSASDVDTQKKKTRTGTAVEYEGRIYVQLDGSDQLTPLADRIAGVKDGDRVTIEIENHSASLTGNLSDPSVGSTTVAGIENQIEQFNVIIANKADIDQLNAAQAKIDELEANDVTITGKLDAVEADIGELEADNVTINNKLTANEAEIEDLKVTKLDAAHADITYAKIDFANIGDAAIENFFAKSGMIDDLVVSSGTITGTLVGVTIKGDLIEGGTVVADKLVIQGEDGLYYKLNTDGETVSTEQTEYNSLSGTVITAKSITAEKISVDDLVAFGATIGGFHITTDSLYSGVKESIENSTPGVFMDSEGNFSLGDQDDYLKFFKDTDGNWKLQISASSVNISSSQTNVEEVLDDIQNEIDGLDTIYTTKTEFQQTTNSISASVSEVSQTANSALQKATSVEVTANGLTTTVSEVSDVADAALESAQATASDLTNFTNAVNADLSDLQSQIDGSIQTWFYAGVPTLTNEPASEWTTTELKNNHLGDLYYDTDTDYAYRFMLQNGVYSWDRIQDSDAVKALQDAAKAQDTADGKRRVFVAQPMPPYDVGDLWAQGSTGDLMRCQVAKTANQSYSSSDWVLATKYTDDTTADAAAEAAQTAITKATEVEQTVDGITTTVSETVQTANEAYTKASQVEQTVDGITTTVTDLNGNVSSLEQTVNGFEVSINNANSTANSALSTAQQNGQLLYECQVAPPKDFGMILLTSDRTISDGGNAGYAHIWGWMGSWSANSGGYIDVMVPLRHTSYNTIVVTQKDNQIATYGSGNGATLRVYKLDEKVRVTLAVKGYAQVKLFVEGKGFTINRTGGNSARGTYIWDSDSATAQDAKTATNYLRFDSTGLCVGNYAGTLQGNVKIDSDGIDIYCGNTLLAWMNANTIALGENSTASYIRFSAGAGSIGCGSGGEAYLHANGRDLSVIGNNLHARGDLATTIGNSTSVASVSINSGNIYMSKVGNGQQTYTPVYRLNNPNQSNVKMWTATVTERNALINAGWTYEGTGWYAFA